jgi:hypothetical protein
MGSVLDSLIIGTEAQIQHLSERLEEMKRQQKAQQVFPGITDIEAHFNQWESGFNKGATNNGS